MKRKIMRIAGLALALVFLIGLVFCIARPQYVREAVSILLGNELEFSGEESIQQEETSEENSMPEGALEEPQRPERRSDEPETDNQTGQNAGQVAESQGGAV